ncbi:hypothetical protein DPX16_15191 [Anabarilius grahami]|uniref:Uncharacterized protein n=1 Tax=Anabarilius grahami TaxID=495550 RepID=A0A3N0YVX9_ANAGA|nr:hypothetical protein DPX16_15191 [Anabarilius grahami]
MRVRERMSVGKDVVIAMERCRANTNKPVCSLWPISIEHRFIHLLPEFCHIKLTSALNFTPPSINSYISPERLNLGMTEASETKRAPVQYISFDFQITEDKEEK